MKQSWILPVLLVVAGCGDDLGSADGVVKAHIDVLNDMTDVLKTVKDKGSAEAAKSKLEALGKRADEIEKAMSKTQPDEKIAKKYAADVDKAQQQFSTEMMRIMTDPQLAQVFGDLDLR
jgi:hypothetical protein